MFYETNVMVWSPVKTSSNVVKIMFDAIKIQGPINNIKFCVFICFEMLQ